MEEELKLTDHRPWPVPRGPWGMRMTWEHLAFLHWRAPAGLLQRQLPSGLKLDTFEGEAWLGVVPFFMTGVRARGLPGIPTAMNFLELNLRTYVIHDGRPGVWFFSLDAASWLCVRAARMGFHLPYFDADMDASVRDDIAYRSRRIHQGATAGIFRATYAPVGEVDQGATAGIFRATYAPVGEVFKSRAGSLEHWLTERYCLYSANRFGKIYRGEIHHRPWPLQQCRATIRDNSLGNLIDYEFSSEPESVLFARRLDVAAWRITRCQDRPL